MEIIVVLLLIAFVTVFILLQYRRLMKLKKDLDKTQSNIRESIQQRLYIVQNIASILSTFPNQGRENAQYLINRRDKYIKDGTFKEAQEINALIMKYYEIISRYPQIKATHEYMYIQQVMIKTEKEIRGAKDNHNKIVDLYNAEKKKIPNNIICTLLDYEDEVKI